MIEGAVNSAYEAIVPLRIQGLDGQTRDIEADATGSTPLIGMLLLDKHTLTVDVEAGGRVLIEAKM